MTRVRCNTRAPDAWRPCVLNDARDLFCSSELCSWTGTALAMGLTNIWRLTLGPMSKMLVSTGNVKPPWDTWLATMLACF
eukprot:2443708-Pyramimonas_sp.AAC.1